MSHHITIEIVYAPNAKIQHLIKRQVLPNCSVLEAIEQSGVLLEYPDIKLTETHKLGVWNKAVDPEQPLREGDRIEIYRPLIADPKESRRKRANKEKQNETAQ